MRYCMRCGSPIYDGNTFCTRCGAPAEMCEEFRSTLGIGKSSIFLKDSLIYNRKEYRYEQLAPIEVVSNSAPLFGGLARTTADDGTTLELVWSHRENQRFMAVLSYANEKIKQSYVVEEKSYGTPRGSTEPVRGKNRSFEVYGHRFLVSEELDIYNTYRNDFKILAKKYTSIAKNEYETRVTGFSKYMALFPRLYESCLSPIIQRAVDILISEGIWNVTKESFQEQHKQRYHLAMSDYKISEESVELTIKANQDSVSGIMSFVPNLIGGGFGLKGIAKGIATATIFNTVRDGIESKAQNFASYLTQEQQAELYGRINANVLFDHVFDDYWKVYLSMVSVMRQNNKRIWFPDESKEQQADNVFNNLSNPNFPKDKITDAWFMIVNFNPYKSEYYNYARAHLGKSEGLDKLQYYFGVSL